MKTNLTLILIIALTILSCTDCGDDDPIIKNATTTLKFSHNWNGAAVTNTDFNIIKYTNANGDLLSIERLRYVISNITFTTIANEQIIVNDYFLVDVANNNLSFTTSTEIPIGNYTNVAFTFGLNNEDNSDNYIDLNSASFNVPTMLGGGYHYMQFDGKFINASSTEQGFNYHAIRAVDNPGTNPTFPQDTFFTVNLGAINITDDTEIEIKMNIAEWFKTPNLWDLNTLNQMLMPNSAAQILMYQNGQNVFSLGAVTQ